MRHGNWTQTSRWKTGQRSEVAKSSTAAEPCYSRTNRCESRCSHVASANRCEPNRGPIGITATAVYFESSERTGRKEFPKYSRAASVRHCWFRARRLYRQQHRGDVSGWGGRSLRLFDCSGRTERHEHGSVKSSDDGQSDESLPDNRRRGYHRTFSFSEAQT